MCVEGKLERKQSLRNYNHESLEESAVSLVILLETQHHFWIYQFLIDVANEQGQSLVLHPNFHKVVFI